MRDASLLRLAVQFPRTELQRSLKELRVEASESIRLPDRAYSSVGLERTPDKREVGGSNPPRPTNSRHGLMGL
jgi:hypothetical protein